MLYLSLKVLHILAVVVFVGNVIGGLYWGGLARQAAESSTSAGLFAGIRRSEALLSRWGIIVMVATGIGMPWFAGMPVLSTGWLLWPIGLLTVVGVLYGSRIGPLQRRLAEQARASDGPVDQSVDFLALYRQWLLWTWIGLALLMVTIVIMVMKLPLPAFST